MNQKYTASKIVSTAVTLAAITLTSCTLTSCTSNISSDFRMARYSRDANHSSQIHTFAGKDILDFPRDLGTLTGEESIFTMQPTKNPVKLALDSQRYSENRVNSFIIATIEQYKKEDEKIQEIYRIR